MDPQRPDDYDRDHPYTEYANTEPALDPITAAFPNIYSPLYDWTGAVGGPVLAGVQDDALQNAQFQLATTATASQSPVPEQQGYYSDRRAEIPFQQGWTDSPTHSALDKPLQERVDSASNGPNAGIANRQCHARLYHGRLNGTPQQSACQSQTGQNSRLALPLPQARPGQVTAILLTTLSLTFASSRDSPGLQCRWENCTSKNCFRREADLMRHIKTIHVSPRAHECPVSNCGRCFGRKDHLGQHKKRRH